MADRRALACGTISLLLIVVGCGLLLAERSEHRAGTDGVFSQAQAQVPAGMSVCQGGELLPADTAAVRIAGTADQAPPLVTLRAGRRVLARVVATLDGNAIVARIPRTRAELTGVEVCLELRSLTALLRGPTPPDAGELRIGNANALQSYRGSSMAVTYLLAGRRSWLGMAPLVAARMGRGRGRWDGGWTVAAIVALVAASLALAARIVWRTLVSDRPARRLGVAIMAVAALNAAAWSLITPPFRVPDEVGHVAYVQAIGETGSPPRTPRTVVLSPEQQQAMLGTRLGRIGAGTSGATVWSPIQQRRLAADLRLHLSPRPTLPSGELEPEPPLYYALAAIPYTAGHGATLLDRMLLMRLFSALLAGVTALLSFLFVRECLPSKPWAWGVGGLGVAFAPMLGFVSGGVTPDALLFALAAALFLSVARAWRRGATTRRALVVGALIAAGLLTKVNFYGLVPGALLGFALAARRTTLAWDRRCAALVGTAAGLAGALFALGVGFDSLVWHRPYAVGRQVAPESHVGLWQHVGYIWQVFLPRLPFQPHTNLLAPGYQQIFKTFVGAFGSLEAWLPAWAYRTAAVGFGLVALLAGRMLRADRRELRWRRGELLAYAAMAGALMLLVGLSADLRRNMIAIVQGRYLLPLLPLFGVLLALAARGAGERWGRATGVAIIAGAVALSLLGQLATVAFFYG